MMTDTIYGETFEVSYLWGKRRRFPRYDLIVPVGFVYGESLTPQVERGLCRDIGMGGIGVLSRMAAGVREHDVVSVQLSAHGIEETLRLYGVVVYADPEQGFGLQFAEFTPRTRVRLKRLLTHLAA